MSKDLISREALKAEVALMFGDKTHISECICDLIDNAPTVFSCNACKNMGNERECVDCHDYSNYVHYDERPQGVWLVTAEDNDGVHRICCPFCSYEKGSNNTDAIIVTFTNFPKFCENCGAKLKGGANNG